MSPAVRIGILGDFNTGFPSHHATNASLQHAAKKFQMKIESEWVPTRSLMAADAEKKLESFDGLWASPGSPYQSFDGMLRGIEFARLRNWPFLATCGGFQYTLIEVARNVLNIADADSAENNSESKNIVIYPVACAVPNRAAGAPKLSGAVPEIRLRPGSFLQSFYGRDKEAITEEFFCNFEVNPEFEWMAMEAGFTVSARGTQGEIRAIESPAHQFYIATLFQPQLASSEGKPHPLVVAFAQTSAEWSGKKFDDRVLE